MVKTPQTINEVLAAGQTKRVFIGTAASFECSFDGHDFQVFYPGIGYPASAELTSLWVRDYLGGGCAILGIVSDAPMPLQDNRISPNAAAMAASLFVIQTNTGNLDVPLSDATALLTTIDADTGSLPDILAELQGPTAAGDFDTETTLAAATATEILPANANRVACVIQNKSSGAASVYIGFSNQVTNLKWALELETGRAYTFDNYRGPLYAYSVAGGEKIGYGEW